MQDFVIHNTTRYVFGKNALSTLSEEVRKIGNRVLVVYGQGSIKKNGVYDTVMTGLHGFEVKEFGGIEPNPRVETLRECIALARDFQPDILLAVGGGSVIDGVKLVSAAVNFQGDPWEIIETKPDITWECIPIGTVLTISATGSEMNMGSVITNWTTNEKDYFSSAKVLPVFSLVDPQVQYTLPKEQIAYGIIDAYSHVLEQYITDTTDAPLQDRFAEGILHTLIENGVKAVIERNNYEARANIVFAATMALNNLIGSGVSQDWASHEIEHVISGFYDIPHGAGLAIVHPRVLREVSSKWYKAKLVQYGKRVWNLVGTDEQVMQEAVQKTLEFFISLGVKTTLPEWNIQKEEAFEKLVDACDKRGEMGGIQRLSREEIERVINACFD